jgi:hypothetical protein
MGVVDQVKTVAVALAGLQEPKTDADRAEALSHLPIGEELVNAFNSALLQFGFTLGTTDLLDPADDSHTVSVASSKNAKFYIVSLPFWLLSDPQYANIGAFGIVENLFPGDSVVYIISRDLENMATAFTTMMAKWKYKGIKATFIPWPKVAKFQADKNEETRLQRVRQIFEIQSLAPVAPSAAAARASVLNDAEEKQVVRVIVNLAGDTFSYDKPQDCFQFLVQSAKLPSPAKFSGHWSGNPDNDAAELVNYAKTREYPLDHAWAGQKMLGRILAVLLEQNLAPDDATMIAAIVKRHALISDPQVLSDIELKYSPPQGGVS